MARDPIREEVGTPPWTRGRPPTPKKGETLRERPRVFTFPPVDDDGGSRKRGLSRRTLREKRVGRLLSSLYPGWTGCPRPSQSLFPLLTHDS